MHTLNRNYEMQMNSRPFKVLFVCLGNICRSPAAEGIMKRVISDNNDNANWVIDSAGTGNWHVGQLPDSRMRGAGSRRGYTFDHRCRQLTDRDFYDFDLIIGMDDDNMRNIRRLVPDTTLLHKVHNISEWLSTDEGTCVPDPYYGDLNDFYHVIDLLQSACGRIFDDLRNNH